MTARGPASVYVHAGDVAAIGGALDAFVDEVDVGNGTIQLQEVNWLDHAAMIAADPTAVWEVFLSPDCEAASQVVMYHPELELGLGGHVDYDVVVHLDLAVEGIDAIRKASLLPWVEKLAEMEGSVSS